MGIALPNVIAYGLILQLKHSISTPRLLARAQASAYAGSRSAANRKRTACVLHTVQQHSPVPSFGHVTQNPQMLQSTCSNCIWELSPIVTAPKVNVLHFNICVAMVSMREPGSFKPTIAPGFAQCAMTS
jgi:hypothetical protein